MSYYVNIYRRSSGDDKFTHDNDFEQNYNELTTNIVKKILQIQRKDIDICLLFLYSPLADLKGNLLYLIDSLFSSSSPDISHIKINTSEDKKIDFKKIVVKIDGENVCFVDSDGLIKYEQNANVINYVYLYLLNAFKSNIDRGHLFDYIISNKIRRKDICKDFDQSFEEIQHEYDYARIILLIDGSRIKDKKFQSIVSGHEWLPPHIKTIALIKSIPPQDYRQNAESYSNEGNNSPNNEKDKNFEVSSDCNTDIDLNIDNFKENLDKKLDSYGEKYMEKDEDLFASKEYKNLSFNKKGLHTTDPQKTESLQRDKEHNNFKHIFEDLPHLSKDDYVLLITKSFPIQENSDIEDEKNKVDGINPSER